jgi:hypothetical protein
LICGKITFSGLKNEEFFPERKGGKKMVSSSILKFSLQNFCKLSENCTKSLFLEMFLQKSQYFEEKKLYTS